MAGNSEASVTFKAFNKDFNKAISDMGKESSNLRSELKLQEEQMKHSATQTEKLEAKLGGLQRQYDLAKQKTAETAAQLERAKAIWGENSVEVGKLEEQLRRTEIAEQQIANTMTETTASLGRLTAAEEARTSASGMAAQQLAALKTVENELKDSTSRLSAEYGLQKAQLGENASEIDLLALKMDHLNQSHDAAGEKVRNYEEQLEQARAQYGENSTEIGQYEQRLIEAQTAEQTLANDIAITNGRLEEQQAEANRTVSAFEEMGESIRDVGSEIKDAGDAMTDAGVRMTAGITAPILGVAAAAKDAWGEVDDGLDTIVSKTGASGDALASLEESFSNVASTTKFDMQQVGDAIGEVNTQFGLTGPALDAAATKMLKFADINGADVTGSSIKSKQAMEAFGLAAEDLDMALDSVTKTAQNTGQSTDSLMDAVRKGAPQLKSLGLDFAQSTEVMGQFEQAGIDSGAAVNYLGKAQVSFAKDGKDLQTGLMETVYKIQNAKTETDRMTIAAKAFGTKGASRMIEAIQKGALNFDEFATAATDSAGAVDSTFDGMEDPIDSVGIAMNNLKLAGADLFGQLQEMLLPIGLQLIAMLQQVVTWFTGLSDGMKKTIIVVLAIAAAIGPLLVWVGLLVSSIGSIVTGVGAVLPFLAKLGPAFTIIRTALAALTGPIGIIVALVVALGIVIYKNWDAIKEATIKTFSAIGEFLTGVWGWIVEVTTSTFNSVSAFFKEWGSTILIILGGPIAWITALVIKNWDTIKATTIKVFSAVGDFFATVWNTIKSVFTNVITGIVNFVKQRWESLKTNTSNVFNSVKDTVLGVWTAIKTTITNLAEGIKNAIRDKFESLKSIVKEKMDAVKTIVTGIWDKVKAFFDNINLLQTGKDIIQGLINGIRQKISAVTDAIKEVTSMITGKIKSILGIKSPSTVMKGYGVNTGEGLALGIVSTKKMNEKAMKSVGKGILNQAKKNNKELDAATKKRLDYELAHMNDEKKGKKKKASKEKGKKKQTKTKAATTSKKTQATAVKKAATDQKKKVASAAKAQKDAVSNKFNKVADGIADRKSTGNITHAQEAAVWKKSIALFKKGSKERIKAQNSYNAAMKADDAAKKVATKDQFDSIKEGIENKKSLDQLSLTQESEIWRKSIDKFKKGSKERIAAQKEYQKALKVVNDSVNKVNEDFNKRAQKIDDDYTKNSSDAMKGYTDAFKNKYESLLGFAGLFDEFEIKMEKTGADLLLNLSNQVDGFARWQSEIGKLSMRGTDETLLAELREMGPKALPELIALNELTDDQLSRYSELYRVKSEQARKQAEAELSGMKEDVEKSIEAMRAAANTELEVLQVEWVAQIKAVTTATGDELQSLQQIGRDAGQGLINGLASMQDVLKKQATTMAQSVSETIRKVLDINSPSRVLEQLGVWTGEGLAVGIDKTISDIKASAKNLASAAIPQMASRPTFEAPESNAAIRGRMQSQTPVVDSGPGVITNSFHIENMEVRDDNDIKSIARELLVMQRRHERGRGR